MIEIKKAKVSKVAYLEVEYTESIKIEKETLTRDIAAKCNYAPHQDLLDAFAKLKTFMVELCDQKINGNLRELPFDDESITKEVRDAALSDYTVTGFTIGGTDEHEGVTLIGRKKLANNRVLNLVSPFTKWQDEHNEYDRIYELQSAIEACQSEVELYLLEHKRAPQEQLALDFEGDENTAF